MIDKYSIKDNKSHLVFDCDEVLVRISPKWVHLMHTKDHFDYFKQFFRLSENFNLGKDYDKILMRPEFYLDKWLMRKDVLDNHTIDAFNEARRELLKLYSGNYYNDLPPTNIAKSLSIVARNTLVDKISIVSRTSKDDLSINDSKIAFLKNLFNGINHKVDIYLVEGKDKKSDVIKQLGGDVGFIYEDETSNIKDMLDSCPNLSDMCIMVPTYGYNSDLDQSYVNLAKEKNIEIKYYYDR